MHGSFKRIGMILGLALMVGCSGAPAAKPKANAKAPVAKAGAKNVAKSDKAPPTPAAGDKSKSGAAKTADTKPVAAGDGKSIDAGSKTSAKGGKEKNQFGLSRLFAQPVISEAVVEKQSAEVKAVAIEQPKVVERPQVRLIGFSNVDGEKALLEYKGEVYAVAAGEMLEGAEGIEVVTIANSSVTFQFAKQRWSTALFEQPWVTENSSQTAFAASGSSGPRGNVGLPSRGFSGRSSTTSFSPGPRSTATTRKPTSSRVSTNTQQPLNPSAMGAPSMGSLPGIGNMPGMSTPAMPGMPGGAGGAPGGMGGAPGGMGGAPGGMGGAPGGMGGAPGGAGGMAGAPGAMGGPGGAPGGIGGIGGAAGGIGGAPGGIGGIGGAPGGIN